MSDEKPQGVPIGLNINMDPEMAKGVHGQDAAVTVTDKDVCLTFFVRDPSGQQAFVTARVFLPHTTAIQLSEIIRDKLGPVYEEYLKMKNKLPPAAGDVTT